MHSLSGLQSLLTDLKAQSQTSFASVDQARKSMPDVEELRDTIAVALKSMEPLLDEDKQHTRASDIKSLVKDLELQCTRSGQVADILRDRLQSVGAELLDAKSRIVELEGAQAADRAALCSSTRDVTNATQKVTELAECLKQQQGELYDVLSAAADAETKLAASTERTTQLEHLVDEKQAELETLRHVQQDNLKLQNVIEDRDMRLVSFEAVKLDLTAVQSELNDRDGTIRALQATLIAKEENIVELKTRITQAESTVQDSSEMIHKLRDDLRICEARELAALKENEHSIFDNRTLQEKVESQISQLDAVRREVESRGERLHQANARCQTLEERFDDQSVTLRIMRESNGDLQERLIAAETAHAQTLQSSTGKLHCEIALLQEQKSHLQLQVDKAEADNKRKEDTAEALKTEYEDKLVRQDAKFTSRLDTEEKRAGRVQHDLDVSRAQIQELQEKIFAGVSEIQDLRDKWKEAKSLTTLRQAEVDTLKSQIQVLETAREQSLQRVKTIDVRYRTGDLVDEEKVFINTLIHTSQAIHEKELVAKGNELRRRDNTIKELRSKVHLLESTLAKHLQAQAKSKTPMGIENQSMIDPASWMSTDRSSSPVISGPHAPDRDAPASILLAPMPLNQVTLASTARTSVASRVPLASLAVPKTPPPVPMTAGPDPVPATSKPMFSRLATDASDDIIDFEDESAIRGLSPAMLLGKRDKMGSPPAAATPSTSRPSKRLVCLVLT
ncbi:hypothetical protein B0H21DRAFT_684427 [Amylocystis lapponica]|nr:hypothetical protein B0H21DRAFT_684427 [Amylocystis lapponica]